jgi:hypothetical protein
MPKIPRVYVDTSTFGGVFDDYPKFDGCREFFELAAEGKYKIVISDITRRELTLAPQNVRDFLNCLPPEGIEVCFVNDESGELAQKYIDAGILSDDDLTRMPCMLLWRQSTRLITL